MDEDDDDLRFQDVVKHLRPDGRFRYKNRGWTGSRQELEDAENALRALGISFEDLKNAEADPPDCTAIGDGRRWAIEVTEIIHDKTADARRRLLADPSLTADPRKQVYSLPNHEWTNQEAIDAICASIRNKDAKTYLGGPFDSILLVIRTEEMHLEKHRMIEILAGFEITCSQITDACLAYGYHPGANDPSQEYPAIRINIRHVP